MYITGRTYQPCDAATDDIYGAALASPVQLEDGPKAIAAAGVSCALLVT